MSIDLENVDPILALKINKGLSMGYDYELIQSVIQQQSHDHDMSKFIETIVRTAEMNKQSIESSSMGSDGKDCSELSYDVFIIDGADLGLSCGNDFFSWRRIEICVKYLHSHGHRKIFVVLPYSMKYHRYDSDFTESKSLRNLERKHHLIYTKRLSKRTDQYFSEILKFTEKNRGYLISNISLKDTICDMTIYKRTVEEKIIRYRFQQESFQPLLVFMGNEEDDCEKYYPLCPYGKKCTYGSRCKYFHRKSRDENSSFTFENAPGDLKPISTDLSLQNSQEKTIDHFEQDGLQRFSVLSLEQESLAERIQSVRHLWDENNSLD